MLLALFLGGFGVHHFYLRRIGLGILYLCFSWTPIPWVLGFIECFFMPGRVREFNAVQASVIAASLGISLPAGWAIRLPAPMLQTRLCPVPLCADHLFARSVFFAPGAAPGVLPAASSGALLACPGCHAHQPTRLPLLRLLRRFALGCGMPFIRQPHAAMQYNSLLSPPENGRNDSHRCETIRVCSSFLKLFRAAWV